MRRRHVIFAAEMKPTREPVKAQGDLLRSLWKARVSLKNGVVTRHARRMMQFCLVGTSGVAINTTVLYVLTEASGLNHLVAAVFSTEAAILNNFLLNDRWTFSDVEPVTSWHRRALRYNSVSFVGLAVSVSVLAGLTYLLDMHYLFANLYAIGAGTLWNYVGNSYLTWATVKFNTPSVTLFVVPLVWCRRLVALVVAEMNKLWS